MNRPRFGFIEEQRAKGRAVESVCKVLREQGVQIAARTYRVLGSGFGPAALHDLGTFTWMIDADLNGLENIGAQFDF